MTTDALLFWFLALVVMISGLSVILMTNPIYSALSLVMTMVGVAGIFVTLQAYFLAGVQLIVYAGAVMVLFVMVLMLFDLKNELQAFARGRFSGALKIASVGILAGLIVGAVTLGLKTADAVQASAAANSAAVASGKVDTTKALAENLFFKNIFGFEALGVLLLVIAVGVVALSRSRGGTHARD